MLITKIYTFIVLFVFGILFGIYPSFVSSPGVDCPAGCAIGKGFPIPYKFVHVGGIADAPAVYEISYQALFIDIISIVFFSLLVSFLLVRIFYRNKW